MRQYKRILDSSPHTQTSDNEIRSASCEQMSIDILPTPSQPDLPSLSAVIFKFLLIHNIDAHPPSAPSTDLVRSSTQKNKQTNKISKNAVVFQMNSSLACIAAVRPVAAWAVYTYTDSGRAPLEVMSSQIEPVQRGRKKIETNAKCKMQPRDYVQGGG